MKDRVHVSLSGAGEVRVGFMMTEDYLTLSSEQLVVTLGVKTSA